MASWCKLLVLGILMEVQYGTASIVEVEMKAAIHTVEKEYISFNLDTMLIRRRWSGLDVHSPRLHNLLRGLSPAYLRMGGSPADWTIFDAPEIKLNISNAKPDGLVELRKSDWDDLVNLTMSTGLELLYDLNLQTRYGTQWDPSNAIQLMEYSVSKGYGKNINFELGNEPLYGAAGYAKISGTQIGADFKVLRKIMDSYPVFKQKKLVGPDVVAIETTPAVQTLFKEFLNEVQDNIHATTWHHYYFEGDKVTAKTYLDPANFPKFEKSLQIVHHLVNSTKVPNIPIWIGETSDAWHEGTKNVSDRYVSGFLWLDKLGLAAKYGTGVVMRQTFYDYYYCLIDRHMYPNPDYWLSHVHKQLVGTGVLSTEVWSSGSLKGMIRVYAHCTNIESGLGYSAGAVTVFALNISPNVTDELMLLGELADQDVDVYLLSPGDSHGVLSKYVSLNGQKLVLIRDEVLPKLVPTKQSSKYGIKLPPYSFGFFVFPSVKAVACSK